MNKPLLLIILDGFGIAEEYGNAIKAANKPNLDRIFNRNPITQIQASSMSVGLPEGQMGNSEVGHTNIGAGRIVYQELTRITKSIQDGDFFENPALVQAVNNAKKTKKALHIMGLLSDGGVHSHIFPFICNFKISQTIRIGTSLYPRIYGRPRCFSYIRNRICKTAAAANG